MAQDYINTNLCLSINQWVGTTLALGMLSSARCSEVLIINRAGANLFVYDKGNILPGEAFILEDNESFTFRGITNANQVSAVLATGTGLITCRTAYTSMTVRTH